MRSSPRVLLGLLSCVLLAGSCVGSDSPTGVGNGAAVGVGVQPSLIPTPADGSALPINRIRVSVARADDGVLLAQNVVGVSPTDTIWVVDVQVPDQYASEAVYIFVRLINVASDGTAVVQFSGRSDVITLVPGEQISPDIPIVRGPVANLFTTGLSITGALATMVVGQSQVLTASVTTSGSVAPNVFWTSLDPAVLSMAGSTATPVAAGTTQVVASAGSFADTANIQVFGQLGISTASLPNGTQGVAYSQALAATGGSGAYSWSVSAGALPLGLTLALGTGVISGTPTTVENAGFTVQVQSGDGQTATRGLAIAVADDVPAGFTIAESSGSTDVDESGTTDDFTVVLDAQPATNVVLTLSSDDTGEATASPVTLTFTNANWNVAQTVTVTGIDDTVVDGDQLTEVAIAIDDAASDNAFDSVGDDIVTVTTTDDDVAGFTVAETGGGTTVNESGTTDTITVVLAAQPVSNVLFDVSSGNVNETTVSPATLTFTNADWNVAQVVTVTGVDDAAVDGDQATDVTVSVNDAASQLQFGPLGDQIVSVTTTDDDVMGGPVIRWGSVNSGSWNAASNWTPQQIPTVGDSVVIDGAGTFTVLVDQDVQVSYLTLGGSGGTQTLQFLSGQTMTVDSAAVVTPNGVIDLTSGILAGPGTFTSSGTILKPTGAGLSVIQAFLENSGSVDVQQGALELVDGTVHSGTFAIGSGAVLRFTDVDTLGINGPITGPGVLDLAGGVNLIFRTTAAVDVGSLRVLGGANFFDGSVAITDSLRISAGSFRPNQVATDQLRFLFMDSRFGSLGGRLTVEVTDSLNISQGVISTQGLVRTLPGVPAVFPSTSGVSAPRVGRPLELQGPSLWTSGNIRLEGINGIFDVLSGGTLDITHTGTGLFEQLSANGAFVRVRAGGAMTKSGGGVTLSEVPFVNEGALDVQSGTFTMQSDFTHAAGAVLQGTGILNLTTANVLAFDGDVRPGDSPGILTIDGPYAPSAQSTLSIELAGTTVGTGHDQLVVTGTATLAGDLVVDTLGAFVPSDGDQFAIMTFGTRVGDFASVTLPTITGVTLDTVWTSGQTPDTLYVVASGGPPGTLNSWTGGGASSFWSDGANWSSGVPSSGDSVVVEGASNFGILLDQDVQIQSLTIGSGGGGHVLDATGFNLRASANIEIGATGAVMTGPSDTISSGGLLSVLGTGVLDLEGSTIDGALYNEGALSVQNASSITGALTTSTTSVLSIEGNGVTEGALTLAGGFTNNGLIELTDAGGANASITVPGTLVNSGTGTIRSLTSASNFSRFLFGVLDNRGAVEVSENLSIASATGTHLNSGTISVTDGTLTLNMNQASFTNEATGSIQVSGTGDFWVFYPGSGSPSFTHSGSMTVGTGRQILLSGAAGSFDITGSGSIANDGVVQIGGGMIINAPAFTHTGTGTLLLLVTTWNGSGALTNAAGATIDLRQAVINADLENLGTAAIYGATINGQLIVPDTVIATFTTPSTPYILNVDGVDVDGAVFSRTTLQITGTGTIARLDNVSFQNQSSSSTQLWVAHPGAATPFNFEGLSFTQPTSNAYIRADDSSADANVLTINLTNSDPVDGSAFTTTNGGAVVTWGGTPGPAPDAGMSSTTIDEDILGADGLSTAALSVQLRDSAGNDLTGGSDIVTFTTTLGSVGPVTDNGDGTYSATFSAGTTGGVALVAASVNGNPIPDTLTVRLASTQAIGAQAILFTSDRDGIASLWAMDADGSNPLKLLEIPGRWSFEPTWSPTGNQFAFTICDPTACGDGGRDIFVANADGTGLTRITDKSQAAGANPVWSPDGSRIAFARSSPPGSTPSIYVMNPDGSQPTFVISQNGSDRPGGWSPNSQRIAYSSGGTGTVRIVDVTGSNDGALISYAANSGIPVWSDGGLMLASYDYDATGRCDIQRVNPDGSGLVSLTSSSSCDAVPHWMPDDRLLFRSDRDGDNEVYMMNQDGSGQVNLTNDPSSDSGGVWRPGVTPP